MKKKRKPSKRLFSKSFLMQINSVCVCVCVKMQKEKLIIQVWLQTGITEGCYTLGCSLPPLMSFTCGRLRTCRDKPRIPHITELLLARNSKTFYSYRKTDFEQVL